MPKIRVLCVDDSSMIRSILKEIINAQPDMEVVAVAPDPIVARDLIKQHDPDILTLDVEMPRMDGLDFLSRLMRLRPMPVLMISSLTQAGSEVTLRALELGAVDFIAKPQVGIRNGLIEYADILVEKIREASKARPRQSKPQTQRPTPLSAPLITSEKLVIIGSSTGGTEALRVVLEKLPANSPAIMIAQHMPGGFTKSFAERLDRLCNITVKEAEDNERILPGHAYIAPGTSHLKLAKSGANYIARLDDGDPVNRHRPSVDVLFRSAAQVAGKNAIGALLTGMGKDGAQGLLEMRKAGSHTFAQDEETCVVFGMPKEGIALGGACEVVSIHDMSEKILRQVSLSGRAQRV